MPRSVRDIFDQFDEACRAIFKVARDLDHKSTKTLAPRVQAEIEPFLGGSQGENSYANHVAHGMAKLRALQ